MSGGTTKTRGADVAYKRLDDADLAFLREVCGEDRVIAGTIGEDYCHDELSGRLCPPEAVVFPVSADEVSKILSYANGKGIPVTPRGQGTGLVGGAVSVRGGILLVTTRMNRILELDEDNLTLTVEPGVLLMEIAAFVESKGFFYPPDPGEKSATIGGNISTNAGGMRAVKYGVTRDYVRGLEFVLADGTVMETGGKVVKNSSGYSLKDLIVGSEGTLAVVTKAVLRLLPLPAKVVSLLVPFPSLGQAIGTVPKIIRSKAAPTAVEFMEREVILDAETFLGKQFPDKSADAYLLLSFDGPSKEDVEKSYDSVAALCLENGALDVFISDTTDRQDSLWAARRAFLEAIKASTTEMDECDVVVPRKRVADFIGYTAELRDRLGVRLKSFGHAGDGNLHVYVLRDDLDEASWKGRLDEAFDALYAKARELGGLVSGEHGIGSAKRGYLRESAGDRSVELQRRVKAAFDPGDILNPDKIC